MAKKAKKKLKRPFSAKHLAALRAAHKKRRGKKRGKYKANVELDTSLVAALTNYNPDIITRQRCVEIANISYIHNADTESFLKFVDAMFRYIKNGELSASDKPATWPDKVTPVNELIPTPSQPKTTGL